MKKEITRPFQGLHKDNSFKDQPKDTYTFALNAVNETEKGDSTFISNEESNFLCVNLPNGHIPIGKVYIGLNKTVIFSVSKDNLISEIGLLKEGCKYETLVNDFDSPEENKLNFKVTNQIDATYRLRRGCDDTIYFTDNLNPPRYFNISQPEDFKDKNGKWVGRSFSLIKSYNKIPKVEKAEVINNQGSLLPGSYSVLIQYLDDDFNGTAFLTEIPNINIYHDDLKNKYSDIGGSIDLEAEAYNYGKTNKAIRINYSNFDDSYNFYRLAFIHYTSNTGSVSKVIYSSPISTKTNVFTYTGDNGTTEGSIEEIQLADNNGAIQKAESIEQIENKLILANTKGQEVEFCKIQKYASKIKADCVVKDILLTTVSEEHNSKNPLVKFNGMSYQPGEIYSFGIVYVFDDMTSSPVFHIPGRNPDVDKTLTYTSGKGVYPMSNVNNYNESESYIDNSSCSGNSYWGVDSEGKALLKKKVRHHRFPTRNELGVGFVKKINVDSNNVSNFSKIRLVINGNVKVSDDCSNGPTGCVPYDAPEFRLTVTYKVNGDDQIFQVTINPDGTIPNHVDSSLFLTGSTISELKLLYTDANESRKEIPLTNNESEIQDNNLSYKIETVGSSEDPTEDIYQAPIFGIKFSDVELPPVEVTGKKCIGYYIVRQERTDQDKTILDSGVVLPTIKNANFISSGIIAPDYDESCEKDFFSKDHCYKISKQNIQILAPLHKFSNETYDNFTKIEEQGYYKSITASKSGMSIQNVYDGSSADGVKTNSSTSDDDGYTLKQIVRNTKVYYTDPEKNKFQTDNSDSKLFNLNGLSSFKHDNNTDTVYNLAMGNKALILSKNNNEDLRTYRPNYRNYPYVYIKSEKQSFYSNFRVNPYYSQTVNLQTGDAIEVYQGDIHICPLRYDNHVFCGAVAGERRKSLGFLDGLLAVLTVAVGVVAAVFSGGSSLILVGGILTALSGVAMGAASTIEVGDFNDLYRDKWTKGLDKTVFDKFYHYYMWHNRLADFDPLLWRDDTFKWYGDIVGDFWFETPINISLRVSPGTDNNNFLKPLTPLMHDRPDKLAILSSTAWNNDRFDNADNYWYYKDVSVNADSKEENYFLNKITEINNERKSGYLYKGVSIPKIYLLNTDHNIQKNVKAYFHLPIEYDCCSDCNETFPHRWYWSETSFQEELTDNYRTFLPNNYKDLDGENGAIRNVFKLNNELFIHTEEGLWLQPRNHQERVTDQIVSFIGTGDFGSVPPKRMIDDDTGSSAGTQHKWSTLKTPYGYFFVSENEAKIYQFTGQLKPISDNGVENWFQNNIDVKLDNQYYKSNNKIYPYKDNPSNSFGTGFIMTYDSTKERILVTKKDKYFSADIQNQEGFDICVNDNNLTIFLETQKIIDEQTQKGYVYEGIKDCRMKFYKDVFKTKTEVRYKKISVFKDVDFLVFRYVMQEPYTDLDTATKIVSPIESSTYGWSWAVGGNENPVMPGNEYIQWGGDNKGPGLESILINIKKFREDFPNEDNLAFLAKAFWHTNGNMDEEGNPGANAALEATGYKGGTMSSPGYEFINTGGIKQGVYKFSDKFISGPASNTRDAAQTIGTFNYNIKKGELSWDGVSGGEVPSEVKTVEETVEIEYIDREYIYIDGEIVQNPIELINDWTISYSLKRNRWVSWHSYLPNFYIHQPEKFFSWIHGKEGIWKHNKKGDYQTYYGDYKPFIVEYVSLSTPLQTRIWDDIQLHTEARKYVSSNDEYVDERFKTFNKALLYNSRQCTGIMNLKVKDTQNPDNYLMEQVVNLDSNTIVIDRNERDWSINEIRDIRVDYTKPIFDSNISSVQNEYFIDKVLNDSTLDINKNWRQMESLRDKYLVVRLIFDNFDNVNLLINYSVENEKLSAR